MRGGPTGYTAWFPNRAKDKDCKGQRIAIHKQGDLELQRRSSGASSVLTMEYNGRPPFLSGRMGDTRPSLRGCIALSQPDKFSSEFVTQRKDLVNLLQKKPQANILVSCFHIQLKWGNWMKTHRWSLHGSSLTTIQHFPASPLQDQERTHVCLHRTLVERRLRGVPLLLLLLCEGVPWCAVAICIAFSAVVCSCVHRSGESWAKPARPTVQPTLHRSSATSSSI